MNVSDFQNIPGFAPEFEMEKLVDANTPSTSKKSTPRVIKRNARERRRILQVNQAFDLLRERVPSANNHKKISKAKCFRSIKNINCLFGRLSNNF